MQRVYSDKKLKKTEIIVDTPKTQTSIRTIPISNKLYEVLIPLYTRVLTDTEIGLNFTATTNYHKELLK